MPSKNPIKAEIEEIEKHIVVYKKDKVPGHTFIKTVSAGGKMGHILHGKHSYWLCLRGTDHVSINDLDGYVFGFKRPTLEAAELFAESLDSPADQIEANSRNPTVVMPLPDNDHYWIDKVKDVSLLNIKTGIVFPICQAKQTVVNLFGLSPYNLSLILYQGQVVKDFVLYRDRIDKQSWSDLLKTSVRVAKTTTQPGWGCRSNDEFVHYRNYILTKGVASISVAYADDPCKVMRTDRKSVMEFFQRGADDMLCGWRLATQ